MSSNSNSEVKHDENEEETLCGNTRIATGVNRHSQIFKWSKPKMWSKSNIPGGLRHLISKEIDFRSQILASNKIETEKDSILFDQMVRFYKLNEWLNADYGDGTAKDLIERLHTNGHYPRLWKTEILALKMYTDMTEDCSKLRQSFFSNPAVTGEAQTKLRMGALLWKSAVETAFSHYFSDNVAATNREWLELRQKRMQLIYHGSSNVCYDIFADFLLPETIQIAGPFSTTPSIAKAQSPFASHGHGIIFTLQPIYDNVDQYSRGPINVELLSEHPPEKERLFYNGKFIVHEVYSVHRGKRIDRRSAKKCSDLINEFESKNNEEKMVMLSTVKTMKKLKKCFMARYGSEDCWKLYDLQSMDIILNGHSQSQSHSQIYGDHMIYDGYFNDDGYDGEYESEIIMLSMIDISLIGVILSCLCLFGFIAFYFMFKKRVESKLYPSDE